MVSDRNSFMKRRSGDRGRRRGYLINSSDYCSLRVVFSVTLTTPTGFVFGSARNPAAIDVRLGGG